MINNKFVQLQGPFRANEELIDRIRIAYPTFYSVGRIGIQMPESHRCYINGRNFEIGKAEILELEEVNITSIYFQQDEPSTTLVDCVLI